MKITANLRLFFLPAVLMLIIPAPAAMAQARPASPARVEMGKPFYVVERGRGFATLQEAVDAIADGRGTIRIASGQHRQCAVQAAGDISYVAAEAGGATFDGRICEGKAALLLRGQSARIDGLVFAHMRAAEENAAPAAAILLEGGRLSIVNSLFHSSDAGLVVADQPGAVIHIGQSSFMHLGRCAAPAAACRSGVEIGRVDRLRLASSHFSASSGGPLISARAGTVDVDGNRFEDGAESAAAAAMLALPSGAAGRIRGNEFLLHAPAYDTAAALIEIGRDDRRNGSRGLVIDTNTAAFAGGEPGSTAGAPAGALFVANYSGEAVAVGDNSLSRGIAGYQRPAAGAGARP